MTTSSSAVKTSSKRGEARRHRRRRRDPHRHVRRHAVQLGDFLYGPSGTVEVIAGINMPMLVKLAKVREECPLEEAVAAAQAAGRKYVTIASRVLAGD